MPLRTPHTVRGRGLLGLGAGRGRAAFASSIAKGFSSPSSSHISPSSSHSRPAFLAPRRQLPSTTFFPKLAPFSTRYYCSSHQHSRYRMAEPATTKQVRKYLQQSHDRIFDNNKKWAEEMRKKKPEFFKDLSAGQSPDYLWIGESLAATQRLPAPFTTARKLTSHPQAAPTRVSPPKPSLASSQARCSSTATLPT